MEINVDNRDGIHVVQLEGNLEATETTDFAETVTALLVGRGVRIVIDLAAVKFISSTALNDLVRVAAQANIQESRVVLAQPSPFVAGVLQTTQLDRFFDLAPSVEEALERLR
jgi:anti-anti-sigma factor